MPEAREVRSLRGGQDRMTILRSALTTWYVRPAVGDEPEDLLVPEYWKHQVAEKKIKDGDEIQAVREDTAWECTYMVLSVDQSPHPKWMRLAIKKAGHDGVIRYDQGAKRASETETHYVKFIPSVKWTVRRKSDNEMAKQGIPNKPEAIAWMHDHCSQLAA